MWSRIHATSQIHQIIRLLDIARNAAFLARPLLSQEHTVHTEHTVLPCTSQRISRDIIRKGYMSFS
jgi:hypothetical protein